MIGGYLYRGIIYAIDEKPIVYHWETGEAVDAHPLPSWDYLKVIPELEGYVKCYWDGYKYIPLEDFRRIK